MQQTLIIRDGYEYEVLILDDENYKYKVLVNYKGFEQHLIMWFTDNLNEGIDRALEELNKTFEFEKLIFEYE